jgi:NAD(P)-dependent dehydrogenase (short-subunit alcohol dehydrogenase family)
MSAEAAPALAARAALVTGGAGGIGAATAHRLASAGARVMIADLDGGGARAVAAGVGDGRAAAVECDVRREADVRVAVAATVEAFGGLDILVSNAGVNAYFDAMRMTDDDWESLMGVDLKATFLLAKHALPHLIAAGSSAIVTISSIHARLTVENMFPYAAAKAGLEGLTRSLALDYGPQGVRANAVAPGFTRTRLVEEWLQQQPDPEAARRRVTEVHPLRRMADPEDVAEVVAFLASDAARAMTGAVVAVDCGHSIRFAT